MIFQKIDINSIINRIKDFSVKNQNLIKQLTNLLEKRTVYLKNLSLINNLNPQQKKYFTNLFNMHRKLDNFINKKNNKDILFQLNPMYLFIYNIDDIDKDKTNKIMSIIQQTNFNNENEIILNTVKILKLLDLDSYFNNILDSLEISILKEDYQVFKLQFLKFFKNVKLSKIFNSADKKEIDKFQNNFTNFIHINTINKTLNETIIRNYILNYLNKNINNFSKDTQKMLLLLYANYLDKKNKIIYLKKLKKLVSNQYDFISQLYQAYLDCVIEPKEFKAYSYELASVISLSWNKNYLYKSSSEIKEYLLKTYNQYNNKSILLYVSSIDAFWKLNLNDLEDILHFIRNNISFEYTSYIINIKIPLRDYFIDNINYLKSEINYFINNKKHNIDGNYGFSSGEITGPEFKVKITSNDSYFFNLYNIIYTKSIENRDLPRISKYYWKLKNIKNSNYLIDTASYLVLKNKITKLKDIYKDSINYAIEQIVYKRVKVYDIGRFIEYHTILLDYFFKLQGKYFSIVINQGKNIIKYAKSNPDFYKQYKKEIDKLNQKIIDLTHIKINGVIKTKLNH